MEKTRVPDEWSNLRLEFTDEYIEVLKERIRSRNKPVDSVLKNRSDVNNEHHKNNGEYIDCSNNRRCTIL